MCFVESSYIYASPDEVGNTTSYDVPAADVLFGTRSVPTSCLGSSDLPSFSKHAYSSQIRGEYYIGHAVVCDLLSKDCWNLGMVVTVYNIIALRQMVFR